MHDEKQQQNYTISTATTTILGSNGKHFIKSDRRKEKKKKKKAALQCEYMLSQVQIYNIIIVFTVVLVFLRTPLTTIPYLNTYTRKIASEYFNTIAW